MGSSDPDDPNPVLPSTVTKPVTSQETSKAVESRDANHVFEKILYEQLQRFDLCPLIADDSVWEHDCP